MRSEVAVTRKTLAGRPRVLLAVEVQDSFPQAEIAGRPGVLAREVTGQKPLGRPLADPGEGDQPSLHLFVGEGRKSGQIDFRPSQANHVLGFPLREPELTQLLGIDRRKPLADREGVGLLEGLPEGLDEAVADRECSVQGDLLSRDGGDEGFPGIRRERWPQSAEALDYRPEYQLGGRERHEAVEVERAAEVAAHRLRGRFPSWLDEHTSPAGHDPNLAPFEDSV